MPISLILLQNSPTLGSPMSIYASLRRGLLWIKLWKTADARTLQQSVTNSRRSGSRWRRGKGRERGKFNLLRENGGEIEFHSRMVDRGWSHIGIKNSFLNNVHMLPLCSSLTLGWCKIFEDLRLVNTCSPAVPTRTIKKIVYSNLSRISLYSLDESNIDKVTDEFLSLFINDLISFPLPCSNSRRVTTTPRTTRRPRGRPTTSPWSSMTRPTSSGRVTFNAAVNLEIVTMGDNEQGQKELNFWWSYEY